MSGRARALDSVPGLRALADDQDAVVARAQLRGLGVTPGHVAAQVRAGRWRRYGRRVVVLHAGPLTPRQRCWVAVLHTHPRAALSGVAALRLAGLRWTAAPGESVEVVVPRGSRPRRMPGVVVREPTGRLEVKPGGRGQPPRLGVADAAIDAAVAMPSARDAAGLLLAVVQQRLQPVDRLTDALARRGRVRHGEQLRWVLRAAAGGADALSEVDMARLCRRAGLRDLVSQGPRRDAVGRWRFIDLVVRLPDGALLHVEVDGAAHLEVRQAWADMRRQNSLVIAGATLWLHFSAWAVRYDAGTVLEQLRAMRAAHLPARRAAPGLRRTP